MESIKFLKLTALMFFTVAPFASASDSVSISQIAMTGVPIPGFGVTFTSFAAPTADRQVDGETILFWFQATNSNGNTGIYRYDAASNTFDDMADTTMTAPTGGTFVSFSDVSTGAGVLGFIGTDSTGAQGLYAGGNIPLTLIATGSTSPQAGVTFGNFQSISIDGGPYGTDGGEIESDGGVYDFRYFPGNPTPYTFVANTSTAPPGASGPFTAFGPVSYKQPLFASLIFGIRASVRAVCATAGGVQGVYYGSDIQDAARTSAPLVKLVQAGDSIPGVSGAQYTSFGNPIATSNEILFTAHYSDSGGDQQGIFAYGPYETEGDLYLPQSPIMRELVATGQVAPNSNGATFTGFSSISDTSFDETFLASLSNGTQGLFIDSEQLSNFYDGLVTNPPQILKVTATGDTLNGKTVSGIALAPDASNYYDSTEDGYGIGFEVDFTDGSEALEYFTINLPEPACLCFCGLPFLLLTRRRS